ncbi:C40 family peptidase [Nocardia sp. KC 131]|uniref:C40 family peptidase n=1 Tax=Nocardia arseniciresistens TaxID=3392119 RepID=UPI00398F2D81
MTSTEMPQGADFEVDEGDGEDGESTGPLTPWTDRPGHKQGRPRLGAPVPPGAQTSPVSPVQPGVTGQPGRNETPLGTPGQQKAGPVPGAGPPAAAAPAQPAPAAVAPSPPVAEGAAAPPAGQATRYAEPEPAKPLIDPDALGVILPAAATAGTMALATLPMIASALAGLAGGGGTGGGGETTDSGLSPESERALKLLELLAEVYGDGEASSPEVAALREGLGVTPGTGGTSSTGETVNAVKARQMFQRNAATAFNNVDNQLLRYISGLAGNNKVDKKAVLALVREVNVALAQLGPQAYTKQGQQKVREILTAALKKAHTVVSAGQSNSTDTANAINQLTNQYLYNIAGANYSSGVGSGATSAAQRAIEVALAQSGKPYVYGANGPNSFDCSALMQYAAAAAGVKIPRVAADQYSQLPQVNPADIRPGDLIFPANSFKPSGLPGHVIMYIGNGLCMAASRTGVPLGTVPLPPSYRATRWAN